MHILRIDCVTVMLYFFVISFFPTAKADKCFNFAPSRSNADIISYSIAEAGYKQALYRCRSGFEFPGEGHKTERYGRCSSCATWDDAFLPPGCEGT